MLVSNNWKDYECIDAGKGEKLERWGNIILRRPDPWVLWKSSNDNVWNNYHAIYHRNDKGGGYWENKKEFSEFWTIKYKELTFKVSPTGFKHTGLFPEQAANWDFIIDKIKNSNRDIKVLNLFAYTGGATIAASYAGAKEVVHVDASQNMNEWAKENAKLSNLDKNTIRYICDDCLKFVEREKRRGNKYDAIIMDPPTYGRGPSKELWKFEEGLNNLIDSCIDILSDKPLFLLISSYTKGITPCILENVLTTSIKDKLTNGIVKTEELGLSITSSKMFLPCGVYGRWESSE
ncbi:MAG: SAM-dependent methyltransferase [Tenericutes bacterium]|nr:SAM-dependent methyltransferase [Mycoplasmatota bacterium]